MAATRKPTAPRKATKNAARPKAAVRPPARDDEVGALFKAARFQETTSDISRALGLRSFLGKKVGRWVLHAATPSPTEGHAVDLVLNGAHQPGGLEYGTKHRFVTVDALARDLAAALKDLQRLAKDDELLKCPECKLRYVIQKEGKRGTFLSCEGMTRIHRRVEGMRIKDVACRGTSTRIPAVVIHT